MSMTREEGRSPQGERGLKLLMGMPMENWSTVALRKESVD